MEFIDLQAQLAHIRPAIDARIKKVLDHGQFIMGPEVSELEEQLADYVGVKHCISCANGTDALQLSLMALGVGPGDIVFTTTFSFFATAEVISLVGATPYFVDIDADTYNICPKSLEQAIISAKKNEKHTPRAVIAVDLFGLPANYPELEKLCDEHDLFLIEDGAQSFGGSINGKKCGCFGDIATTSFFPAKPLGCYGDGGAIFTQSDELAELCRSMRVHGKGSHKYENVRVGMNSRLDTIQAAVLLEKLRIFEQEFEQRQSVAKRYQQALKKSFKTPVIPDGYKSAWALYTLQCQNQDRQQYAGKLTQKNIPTGIYYPCCLHQQTSMLNFPSSDCQTSEQATSEVFSLPMHPYLSVNDTEQVTQELLL